MQELQQQTIGEISLQGIALIEDKKLRDALASCYESQRGREVSDIGHRLFQSVTSRVLEGPKMCQFLNGYRETHVTALYVSGLMGRVLREADESQGDVRDVLFRAARQVFEIIPEDTGVDDDPHGEIYYDFANYVAGHDQWQLAEHGDEACSEFRNFVKDARLSKDIETGFLTTAASENWNAGEYTYFDSRTRPWLELMGLPIDESKLAYVTVHAGETELGHFLHALAGWKLYCEGNGRRADPEKAHFVLSGYLDKLGKALSSLSEKLGC